MQPEGDLEFVKQLIADVETAWPQNLHPYGATGAEVAAGLELVELADRRDHRADADNHAGEWVDIREHRTRASTSAARDRALARTAT